MKKKSQELVPKNKKGQEPGTETLMRNNDTLNNEEKDYTLTM